MLETTGSLQIEYSLKDKKKVFTKITNYNYHNMLMTWEYLPKNMLTLPYKLGLSFR